MWHANEIIVLTERKTPDIDELLKGSTRLPTNLRMALVVSLKCICNDTMIS